MLFNLLNRKKRGFTLVEVLLICSVFGILVSGVIMAINGAYAFMNNVRIKVRATNLTREGVEMVFNIRDTNWRKFSSNRDSEWLYVGSGNNTQKVSKYLLSGLYVIDEGNNSNGDKFFYAKRLSIPNTSIENFYSIDGFWDTSYEDQRLESLIRFNGDYTYIDNVNGEFVEQTGEIQDLLSNEAAFYRIVRVYGVYKKEDANSMAVASMNDSDLFSGNPLEMRFCVKVFYENNNTKNSSELCSIMTNFME